MTVVALLAITVGAIMLRTAFAPVPDPRLVVTGRTATGGGRYASARSTMYPKTSPTAPTGRRGVI